jgi:cation diffusion facilitator CzcD-associated flavoprotein CzcO
MNVPDERSNTTDFQPNTAQHPAAILRPAQRADGGVVVDESERLDLLIVGGGIGGVLCLKYAKAAGLSALLLERRSGVGGIWQDLPAWQDIQFARQDWTLGSVPIGGEDQASIRDNIQAWVDRFELSPFIRLNADVTSARPVAGGWEARTNAGVFRSRYLLAATGGHNRPRIPVERIKSSIQECHSSGLRDPSVLAAKDVVVVGGGASAYDLLDLCFEHGANRVRWVYRSLKWMRPTRRPKHAAAEVRRLARQQMLGVSLATTNSLINRDLQRRYKKAGLQEILPDGTFDLRQHQLIPGRCRMIGNFSRIERYRGEIAALDDKTVRLIDGRSFEGDMLLWGTGYDLDLGFLDIAGLSGLRHLEDLERRCGSLFLSRDAPNLFFLAPAVLETNVSTPWAYAHASKSIVSHVRGAHVFDDTPVCGHVNGFDLTRFLARRDRATYRRGLWYPKYLYELFCRSPRVPLPIS